MIGLCSEGQTITHREDCMAGNEHQGAVSLDDNAVLCRVYQDWMLTAVYIGVQEDLNTVKVTMVPIQEWIARNEPGLRLA